MKKRIMMFMIMVLVPFAVKANSVSLICDSNVVKGTGISCTLNGSSSSLVTAVSAKVRSGSNISFSSFTSSDSWQGDGVGGNIDLYTANDISGGFVIGTINFGVSPVHEGGNSTITIDSIFFYDDNGSEISVSPVTKSIRIASSVNDLSSLSISTGNLNPNFSSDITSYSAVIDASSISIDAKVKDSNSSISGDIGSVNLNYGNNTFRIVVTSESGSAKTYTINVVRPNNSTNNNTNTESNNNTQDNHVQNNTITKSGNNYLNSITLSSGSINFDKNTLEYGTNVSYDVTDIEVIATTEDSKARVEVSGNKNLVVGNNKILIKVIAEDNSSRIYSINVERKEEDYVLSNNNYISSIKIKDYDIEFNKNKYDYTLNIKSEKELDIEVLLENSKSKYEIVGNNDLKNGSVIKIVVTSEDGNSRTYNINIKSNDKLIKSIFIIIIAILILINIVRIFLKYRSKCYEEKIM